MQLKDIVSAIAERYEEEHTTSVLTWYDYKEMTLWGEGASVSKASDRDVRSVNKKDIEHRDRRSRSMPKHQATIALL
jgi:hypothetical protein